MKNLMLWDVLFIKIPISYQENYKVCHSFNDSNRGELYFCSSNLILTKYDIDAKLAWEKDLKDIVRKKSEPVNLTYLSLLNTLCIGFENGEIITIDESGEPLQLAGFCDKKILAMEWNPDQESFIIITKTYDVITMSCTYDTINEVNLFDEDFGRGQFITVGWGKKETQFHGSEGKEAAKIKNDVRADSNSVNDISIKLSWRGDGVLCAIGFNLDGIRRFKMFDRGGKVQYTSEKVQGLESNLSWRPCGNVIATTQRLNDQYNVAFFEKNGLKHGGFNIPVNSNIIVENILWSMDSEILTLQCRNQETNTIQLMLFTTGNYHWYHKQTLIFSRSQKIKRIWWDNNFDTTNYKILYIFLNSGEYFTYTWVSNIDHSLGTGSNDDAVVAVIDGVKLLLTGFRQALVPPPMAATEIKCEHPISSVHFAYPDDGLCPNSFFMITVNNKIMFYSQHQKFPLEFILQKTITLNDNEFPLQHYNWFWMNDETIVCTYFKNTENKYFIEQYKLEKYEMVKQHTTLLPFAVTRFHSYPGDKGKLMLLGKNGKILMYSERGFAKQVEKSLPDSCSQFGVACIDGSLCYFGLSPKNHFFINDICITGVTSFFIDTHFLLLTTHHHVLLCVELNQMGINALVEYERTESKENIYTRKIERGAKLIIVVPNSTRTVLQMPRGNLEAIQPRPLSLKLVGELLDTSKYYEAFDLMRKQRINLNLIYDHDPIKFVENVKVFLESINNNSWLSLFLSDLEDVDVTQTMYASSYNSKDEERPKFNVKGKVGRICDFIKEHIKKRADCDTKIFPVLTAYVKKNTADDLENALNIIKKLKAEELKGDKLPVGSDEALKYLLYMVDVDQLFNVALGMYDFDLVLLVANKSQKDPKEFIPMLNELNEMDENYRKFTINKYLKRYSKAVQSLILCGPSKYEELVSFIKFHSLYHETLEYFSVTDDIYKAISNEFGTYLCLKKQYIEAGIIFERAECYEKAVNCYKDALEWEMALKLTYNKWSTEQFTKLCWDFVKMLKEEKMHHDALKILEQYCNDNEKTILYAVDAGYYKTAFRLCAKYNKQSMKDEYLVPAILEHYNNLKELIESNWTTFIKYKERLNIVREIKNNDPNDPYEKYFNKDCDLYSDTNSTLASSKGSSRSYRSSKNRRKHERKIASLKEGSRYEDVALIMAIHTLITSTFDLRKQVKNINIALGCISRDKEIFVLQTSLSKLLKEMKDSFDDIWTNELLFECIKATLAAQTLPEGCDILLQGPGLLEPHFRIPPVVQDMNWKLEGYE